MSSPRAKTAAELEARERELDRREADLQAREEHPRLVGELGGYFTYLIDTDADGRLQFPWNPGPISPFAGFSTEEVLSRDWASFVLPDDASYVWGLLMQALRKGSQVLPSV